MDLEKILDSVTPLYKQRMGSLSPQQQEIVDFIALSWDAASTKEIAQKTKLASKAISSQIKQLEKYHIIDKIETDTKNLMYRLSERFFNIWYLMRHGRKWDEKRVKFLVEFLQIWCDREELEHRTQKHLSAIRSGVIYEQHALYMTEALARTPIHRNLQHELLDETRSYLSEKGSEIKDSLSLSDLDISKQAEKAIQSGKIEAAITNLEKIKVKSTDEIVNLATLYAVAKQNLEKAEKYLLMAVEKEHAGAMNNLAWLYFEMKKDKEKALKLAEAVYTSEKNIYHAHTLCTILLWNNEIQRAIEISNHFLKTEDALERFSDDVVLFLMLLMAKKQYHLALNIFRENPHHLKDRFKPVYYALMHFLTDEFPNEHKKMGGELEETVKEIIEKLKQMENDYD